jgi:hypothetical protein
VFIPSSLLAAARAHVGRNPWARRVADRAVAAAEPWLALCDEDLWSLMVGPTLTRSWDVWSTGHCPLCRGATPLYTWQVDAWRWPWKVRCPHCLELFPKNDFKRFYDSGLDRHGLFQYALADRSLLFHAGHPDPAEPWSGAPGVARARRLPLHTPDGRLYGDGHVALEVTLADGRRDLIVAADADNVRGASPTPAECGGILVQRDWGIALDGELAVLRRDAQGALRRAWLGCCRGLRWGAREWRGDGEREFLEIALNAE